MMGPLEQYGYGQYSSGTADSIRIRRQQAQQQLLYQPAWVDSNGNLWPVQPDVDFDDSIVLKLKEKMDKMSRSIKAAISRFKFPALNGFSTYHEGEEMKGVDVLRHSIARWLGTVVAA